MRIAALGFVSVRLNAQWLMLIVTMSLTKWNRWWKQTVHTCKEDETIISTSYVRSKYTLTRHPLFRQ